jgi:transposase-like protein
MLEVSVSTLDRWRRQSRRSGQVAPRSRGHLRCAFGSAEQEHLLTLLRQTPDATIDQLLHAWRETTTRPASRASLARAIVRLNWTRKKRV